MTVRIFESVWHYFDLHSQQCQTWIISDLGMIDFNTNIISQQIGGLESVCRLVGRTQSVQTCRLRAKERVRRCISVLLLRLLGDLVTVTRHLCDHLRTSTLASILIKSASQDGGQYPAWPGEATPGDGKEWEEGIDGRSGEDWDFPTGRGVPQRVQGRKPSRGPALSRTQVSFVHTHLSILCSICLSGS